VITAADIPGTPYLPNCQPQVFLFSKDRVRFRGEAVAAVAADSEEIAELALQKIRVEYEPLASIIELDEALAPDAPALFDGLDNISPVKELTHGDIEKGFAEADIIIENTYSVPVREHAAMEPEAALAYMDEDGVMVIKAPLYHPFVQGQQSIAANLAMPLDRIRIICPAMGGNFGTRGDTLPAAAAALLSIKTKRPVRMVWTRAESLLGSCKAPSVIMKYRTGATKDGKIVALDVDVIHGVGTWGPHLIDATTQGTELCYFETLGALLSHVTGPYEIPNVRARARDVLTNAPRFVPLRGTNGNYLPLAYESQVDQLASKLGIDPLEIRLKNVVDIGSMTHVGQVLKESVEIRAELEALRSHYHEAKERVARKRSTNGTPWKSGLGVACGWRNIGYVNIPITAGAELLADGKVRVLAGTVEQGQGPITQFAQIAADALGVPVHGLVINIGDTGAAPYPVPTFSSITTVGTGKAVQLACDKLRDVVIEVAAKRLGAKPTSVAIENGEVFSSEAPDRKLPLREIAGLMQAEKRPLKYESELQWRGEAPNILYGYNAGLVELAVNEQTGQVRLEHIVNVCDPGTVVNPLALEGQVDGGIGFGVGFALKERFHPDLPPTFEAYGLPTTKDAPERVTRLFAGGPCERGPFGAKSAGEMPGISPIPAIINGIADAIGARVFDIPATPDRVLAALAGRT
jgi:CO/xanthine dehydrogenase Mo-binding subunit